jgi:hypothetical protein
VEAGFALHDVDEPSLIVGASRNEPNRSQLRVARSHYAGRLVDPADPSTIATRHPGTARAVENEVVLVAEFRIVEARDHAGALAGAVYAMPGDWSLSTTKARTRTPNPLRRGDGARD